MMTPREISSALYGLSRLLRMDKSAPDYFGSGPEAFWNSFWVAVWVMPIYAVQSLLAYLHQPPDGGPLLFALLELSTYTIDWVLFPLVMIKVCDWLDRWPNYFRYMTMYNWLSLPVAIAFLPAALLGGLDILPPPLPGLYFLVIISGFLTFSWWIAVHALRVNGATATGIVLTASLLSLISMRVTEMIVG